MINEEFKAVIIDFVDRANEIPNLICAILFGSALEESISKKSDIDILLIFDTDHNPEVGEESKIARKIAGEIVSKHNLAHSFSFVFVNQNAPGEIDPDFLWNVYTKGIIIWGKAPKLLSREPHPSLEPLVLVTYSVKEMDEKNSRGLMRALYGKKRNGQVLIDKEKERLGPGSILVKASKLDEINKIFEKFKLTHYSIRKLWG